MQNLIKKIEKAEKYRFIRLYYDIISVILGNQDLLINYDVEPKINYILIKIIKGGVPKLINIGKFQITLETDEYKFTAWNESKYFAWLSIGQYVNKKTGCTYAWNGAMPSRWLMELFVEYTNRIAKESIYS